MVSCWTDTLTTGQDNLSQTLSQVKQDWDQAHPIQDNSTVALVSGFGGAQGDSLGPSTSTTISGSVEPAI